MRVLHIISEEPPVNSGFARCVERLGKELTRLGHEVDVVSVKDIKHLVAGEIKLCYDLGGIYGFDFRDYDVVNIHGHTPTFSDNFLFSAKVKSRGRPLVYTLHCIVNFYLPPLSKLYNWVMNRLIGLADRIVVTTPSYKGLIRFFRKVKLIPWGVDYNFFNGPKRREEGYNVLFVGQMRPYKGLDILLRAVKGLDLGLHVIGDGPDLSKYVDLAEKLGLPNACFYGNLDDFKLRELYSRCHVLALPSISGNEAFGLVTLEASAAGCAVVASNIPGLRDVVRSFGVLVPPGDVGALRKVLVALSDESLRLRHVERGLEEARKYSWAKTGRMYDQLYREIV